MMTGELAEMEVQLKRLWKEYETVFLLERSPARKHSLRRIDKEIEALSMAIVAAENGQRHAIFESNTDPILAAGHEKARTLEVSGGPCKYLQAQ